MVYLNTKTSMFIANKMNARIIFSVVGGDNYWYKSRNVN